MDYKTLSAINAELMRNSQPFKMGGKIYVEVCKRIQGFWQLYPNGRILTRWFELTENHAICIAEVYDGETLLATGTAREDKGAGMVNKTSYVENAETSAVGRALGNLGIGSVDSVASYDEVVTAERATKAAEKKVAKAPNKKTVRAEFVDVCKMYGFSPKQMAFDLNLSQTSTDDDFVKAIEIVRGMVPPSEV